MRNHGKLRTWRLFGSLCLMSLAFHSLFSTAQAGEKLQPGERIVFLGDSITQAGAGPGGYVTLFREELAKSHADLKAEVIGAGISGNKVPDLEARLDKDVLAHKPTTVIIYIGINDVWHSQNGKGTSQEDFAAGLKRIIAKLTDAGSRVVLCTASVIGEKTDGSNPLDKMLDEYCDISRMVAKETKTPLLDLRAAFLKHLKHHNEKNADKDILTNDGVHLNAAGNAFVAQAMLGFFSDKKPETVLRHCVFFKFKADTTPEQIHEILVAFKGLQKDIPEIIDFEWGLDNSPEKLSQGHTHGFILTFKDEAGRDIYLPHPAHKAFGGLVRPRLESVFVVDFTTHP